MSEKLNQKFNQKLNMDTATDEEIASTNDKLVTYMDNTGETVAAEQIDYLIQNQKGEKTKTSTDPNSFKLLTVNKKILRTLEKIYRDMIDEQDTSIKHTTKGTPTNVSTLGYTNSGDSDSGAIGGTGFGLGDLLPNRLRRPVVGSGKLESKKDPKKTHKPTSKTNKKKTPKVTKKLASKAGGFAGKALRLARVAGPVGLVIGAGMAIYDGVQGWNNAADELGTDGELSTANKASAAVGGIVSGLTFGLANSKNTSQGINNLTGGNKTIEKYQKLGIIDHDIIGNSDVEDWGKLATLAPKEIEEIISINDWSAEDLERMKIIKLGAETAKQIKADTPPSDEADKSNFVLKKVSYDMKRVPESPTGNGVYTSTAPTVSSNPDDYRVDELFKFYKVDAKDFEGLEENTLSNLKAMAAEYQDTFGEKIQINSAYRSFEEQAKLKEKYGSRAAAPGSSMHNFGLAVDMNSSNAEKAISAGLFRKYGFTRPVTGERWHVEPAGIDRAAIRAGGMSAVPDKTYSAQQTAQTPSTSELSEGEQTVQQVKTEGSGIQTPVKTSELGPVAQETLKNVQKEVVAEVSRTQKERVVESTSANLTQQAAATNKGIAPADVAVAIAPMINSNINTGAPAPNEKILALFP